MLGSVLAYAGIRIWADSFGINCKKSFHTVLKKLQRHLNVQLF